MKRLILILNTCGSFLVASNDCVDINKLGREFSESARFETRDPVGLAINVAFNEYAATQDTNEVGYQGNTADFFYPDANVPQGSVVRFGNEYHPGFQIGFMVNTPMDSWNFGGEYQWYRGHSNKKRDAEGTEYYISPLFVGTYSVPLTSLNADWHLSLDLIDLYLIRPYYSGRSLTVEPLLGLKFGSIRQKYELNADVLDQVWDSQTVETKSRSFGVGPKLGCQSNYLMGMGFSLIGDLFTTLLYTRYTTLEANYTNSAGTTAFITENNYGTVRPILDAGIGLGWKGYFGMGSGDYSWHKTFYMSLTAAYNFSLFFSQDMEMSIVSIAEQIESTPGNLYLQGLSVGLDFIF